MCNIWFDEDEAFSDFHEYKETTDKDGSCSTCGKGIPRGQEHIRFKSWKWDEDGMKQLLNSDEQQCLSCNYTAYIFKEGHDFSTSPSGLQFFVEQCVDLAETPMEEHRWGLHLQNIRKAT